MPNEKEDKKRELKREKEGKICRKMAKQQQQKKTWHLRRHYWRNDENKSHIFLKLIISLSIERSIEHVPWVSKNLWSNIQPHPLFQRFSWNLWQSKGYKMLIRLPR